MPLNSPVHGKDPFTAALDSLRQALRDGRFALGEPLTITALAHDLRLSATPIREALSRLAGEGLIEDRRGRGYFTRRLDVADLTELYGLRRLYLVEALHARPASAALSPPGEVDALTPAERAAQILDWVAASAGNRSLFEVYRRVCDRLAPAIEVEALLLEGDRELAALETATAAGPAAMVETLNQIHLRRRDLAPEIIRAMRARANISTL
ncbi:GntR family transcriptional regulator [Caulobacter hibisci]|uniref:GntR family transcriptional regulator n=1 Tax=Caulobacter hibisci TaxID=2035993 RepID=A0ABS0SZW2_9CAUL|nr:GntR family transcriptional regulator [Caulobacter hibisci]MBI1685173.1 GntR family transcriptional regulator [Caulobacter hibisci]